MTVRAKTKRRLVIVIAGVVLLAGLSGGFYVFRKAQIRARYAALRSDGIAAFQKQDYAASIEKLGEYVRRYPGDTDAVWMAAQARLKVELPEYAHLRAAVIYLRRVVDQRPDLLEAQHKLLELYLDLGMMTEAAGTAQRLYERNPRDRIAVRTLARAKSALRQYNEALPMAEQAAALDPMDLEMQVLVLHLYAQGTARPVGGESTQQLPSASRGKIIPRAEALLEQHPDDARFELLMAIAYTLAEELTPEQMRRAMDLVKKKDPSAKWEEFTPQVAAQVLTRAAAKHIQPDLYFVQLVVGELDRLGMGGESLDLLQRTEIGKADPRLKRLLIQRLWQAGRYAEVDKGLATLDPKSELADPALLGIRAMSLVRLDRKPEAAAIGEALAARKGSVSSQAWAAVIQELHLAERPNSLRVALAIQEAVKQRSADLLLRYFLAEAYMRLGEYDQATELLMLVQANDQFWPMPLYQLSRIFAETGRVDDAIAAAEMAYRRAPGTTAFITNRLLLVSGTIDLNDRIKVGALLEDIGRVQKAIPGEETTLPAYVTLLARSGQKAEAERVLRAALEGKNPPRDNALLRLVKASRDGGLGLEQACFDASEKAYGPNPDLALARALDLLAKGRGGEGLMGLEAALKQDANAQDPQWRLAHARFLEEMKDPRAAETWMKLAEERKDDLTVQRYAANAGSVRSNRQFVLGAIDRVRKMTGEEAVGWRIMEARWLLINGDGGNDLKKAAEHLAEVVKKVPSRAEVRVLYATALVKQNNIRGAIEQMTLAANLDPGSNEIALELARLHHSQGDLARAKEQLYRLKIDKLDPNQRRLAVALLAQQGDADRAMQMMQQSPGDAQSSTDDLMRVGLLHQQGKVREAEELLRSLLAKPNVDLSTVLMGAEFYASTGRREEADLVLRKLDDLQLPPGIRDFHLGRFCARYGPPDRALVHLRAAMKAAPDNVNILRTHLVQCVRQGQIREAVGAADAVAAAKIEFAEQQVVRRHSALMLDAMSQKGLLGMMIGMVERPEDADVAAEALRVLVDAVRTNATPGTIVGRLRPLADRVQRFIPLQQILIEKYLTLGRVIDAVELSKRCLASAPNNPELARMAAEVYAASGDWRQALTLAEQWRAMISSQPLPADLFIANLHLRMNNPALAMRQLEPHLPSAIANPDSSPDVLILQAEALLAGREFSKASELLWPLVNRGPRWRMVWLRLATVPTLDAASARAWIERIIPATDESQEQEQLALAEAWYQVGYRLKSDPLFFDRSRELIEKLMARPGASGMVFLARGMLYEREKDLPGAEAAYRKALSLQPDLFVAMNNLAMCLVRRKGDLKEAADLASKAIQLRPNLAALHDTLAVVQAQAGDYKSAAANIREAIRLEPDALKWRVNLLGILVDGQDRNEAMRTLREIDSIMGSLDAGDAETIEKLDSIRAKLGTRPATRPATAPATIAK